jgi:hypothetical protein
VCLLAQGAYASEPLVTKKKKSLGSSRSRPRGCSALPEEQPAVCSSVCSSVRSQKGCSANCEINRAASPTDANPPQQKDAGRGRPRTTTSPSRFMFRRFFYRDFYGVEVWESRRESRAVTHTRPADAMRKTPRFRCTKRRSGARCARTCPTHLHSIFPGQAPRDDAASPHVKTVKTFALWQTAVSSRRCEKEARRRTITTGRAGGPKNVFIFSYAWRSSLQQKDFSVLSIVRDHTSKTPKRFFWFW